MSEVFLSLGSGYYFCLLIGYGWEDSSLPLYAVIFIRSESNLSQNVRHFVTLSLIEIHLQLIACSFGHI